MIKAEKIEQLLQEKDPSLKQLTKVLQELNERRADLKGRAEPKTKTAKLAAVQEESDAQDQQMVCLKTRSPTTKIKSVTNWNNEENAGLVW